jgi:hypothetical protein
MRRPFAVLHIAVLQERSGAILALARAVLTAMTGNAWFPSPFVPLATFEEHIAALDTAETAVLFRTKGNAEERDAKLRVVLADLERLRVYVQHIADGYIADASAIIEGAGMSLKRVTHHDKPLLEARQGTLSGSVILYAKAMRGRCFQDWQYSFDGVHWVSLPSTLQAKTVLSGLPVGAPCFFRVRRSTKAGALDWSDPVRLFVT